MTPEILAKNVRYFSSIRNYTLALLNAFSGVKLYINQEDSKLDKVYDVDITFGNYEKSAILEDLNEKQITQGNFNYLPRLILSFEGMIKAPDRQTNKFKKLYRKIYHVDHKDKMLEVSYNSLAYDFNFTLLLQARGLTQASQLTEEILTHFNPTLNLNIRECPIFEQKTETQIQISDPAFEINNEQQEEDVNIINVTFDLTLRGNIYSPIEMKAPIRTIDLFIHLWDTVDYEDSKMASYYHFEKDDDNYNARERIFDGTIPYNNDVETESENTLILKRPDFVPHEYKYQ